MTTDIVIDASIALAWLLGDERNDDALRLAERAQDDFDLRLAVPPIFWSEATNVLAVSVRRARLTQSEAMDGLAALRALAFEEFDVPFDTCLSVAIASSLSAYDAQYLVLAQELGGALWTTDGRLALAARHAGIQVEP